MNTKTIKNKQLLYIVAFGLLFMFQACSEDFLDRDPLNQVTENYIYSDMHATQLHLDYIYDGATDPWGVMDGWYNHLTLTFFSSLADESLAMFAFWKTIDINVGSLTPSSMWAFQNVWKYSYSTLRTANLFLRDIEDAGWKEDNNLRYLQMIDEVKLLKARIYARLVSLFGPVPIVDLVYTLENTDVRLERNSIEEVNARIYELIDEVLENNVLPRSYYHIEDIENADQLRGKGMVTLAMAHALKARTALYAASELFNPENDMSKWEFAEQVCADAINFVEAEGHTFHPDYEEIFYVDYTDEVIWDRSFGSEDLGYKKQHYMNRMLSPNGYRGWSSLCPSHEFVESYETADGKYIDDPTSGYQLDSFWVNRDPRFYESILYDGAFWKYREVETFRPGGQDSPEGGIYAWNASKTAYNWRKFINPSVPDDQIEGIRGHQNTIYFRYTELILNYAETLLAQGKFDQAREQINKERTRTNEDGKPLMPAITGAETGDDLWKRYRNERRVELALEPHRWFDLRRWKMAVDVLDEYHFEKINIELQDDGTKTYAIKELRNLIIFKERNYWLPIPQSEMDKVGSEEFYQNPGY